MGAMCAIETQQEQYALLYPLAKQYGIAVLRRHLGNALWLLLSNESPNPETMRSDASQAQERGNILPHVCFAYVVH